MPFQKYGSHFRMYVHLTLFISVHGFTSRFQLLSLLVTEDCDESALAEKFDNAKIS